MKQDPWRVALGGAFALAVGMGVGRFVYTPILPVMMDALALTASEAGMIASANYIGHIVGALLAVLPAFRGSRYRILIASLVANALLLAAMAATADFYAHLFLRFVTGIAGAFVVIFSSVLVIDRLAILGRTALSSLHFGGIGIGIVTSAAAVAWLVETGGGWRAMWLVGALISFIGLFVCAWLIPAREPPSSEAAEAGRTSGGGNRFALRAMISAYGLFGFGYIVTATFVVAIVRDTPVIRFMEPYVWVILGLSALPSVALWMAVSTRIGFYHAFAIACLVEAAGVVSSALWMSVPGVILAVVCLGGTMAAITAFGLMAVRNLSAGDPRPNIAWATVAFGVGQVIGPTFAGLLHDWLGSFVLPTLLAAATLVIAAGLGWAALLYRPPETSRIAPVT